LVNGFCTNRNIAQSTTEAHGEEMRITNLKVAVRLGLAFGVILFFLLGIAILSWSSLAAMKTKIDDIASKNNVETLL